MKFNYFILQKRSFLIFFNELMNERAFPKSFYTDENSIFFDDGIAAIALYVDEMAFTAHFPWRDI